MDGALVSVPLYKEHKRFIDQAGYKVGWGNPQVTIINTDIIPVALVEADNGRRRVAAVLKLGTEDEWIEVEQKR